MNLQNNNCSTPKQRNKRLGLRRSSSTVKSTSAIIKNTEVEQLVSTSSRRELRSDMKINYKNVGYDDVNKRLIHEQTTPSTPPNTSSANSIIKSNSAKIKDTEKETPVGTSRRRVPHTDMKINYKNVNKGLEGEPTTPTTPPNTSSADIRLAVSTSCRPYRLALSKRVREKMTKKRLEFYLANEMEREVPLESQTEDKQAKNNNVSRKIFNSRDELLQQIEVARKELTSRQEHLKKVNDLKQAISVWRSGLSAAMHDLQEKFEQRIEMTELLDQLHIPQEMIKYIDN